MHGFPTRRHNEVGNITAKLMSEVCPNVNREPQLQTLTGETFNYKSANIEEQGLTSLPMNSGAQPSASII